MAVIFLVSYFFFLLPFSESVYFKIDRFSADATNILYRGDAIPSVGSIEFNKVNYITRVGQAIYSDAVPIWDHKSRKLTDFTTHFTFIIDTLGRSKSYYGHGLTFFLAPVTFQIPPNSAGCFLGLFNTTYTDSPRNQMIVIEFDTFVNPEWDPPVEHVGINKNSIHSSVYTAWNASLHSGDSADAWVSYNSTTQLLNVRWSYGAGNDSRGDMNTSLSYQVDLREVLPERVMVGFSAATSGTPVERHILQSWEFNSSLVQKDEDNSNEWKLAVGIAVPLAVLILVACVVFWRKKRKPAEEPVETVALTSINDDLERGVGPRRFSYSDLVLATNNFSNDKKLGEGGFGCVYKGYLSRENMLVAVKKISQGSRQGKKEYITEVKVIGSLRHRNLARLIGWCHDQTQFLLVYELMPNGSLDSHLFGQKTPLEWSVRYKIATGLASALLYLHEEWEQCVVHRDIKTSNIMLDSGYNVKLGDFGLARLMDHELGPQTTGLAGTLGYLAPEYVTTGKASKESDVFSFGVVALEIASGRKAMDSVDPNSDLGLVQWVWGLLGNGELLLGVDQRLKKAFDSKQAERLIMVGLWCAHPDRSLRPSIRQALQVLKFEGAVPNLPKKMPVPMYSVEPDAPELSSGSGGGSITFTSVDLVR
ncbi:putative protein kinase RLK-Pelle-L-LEC family [Helianthus annuus]|nr:putative protein kinase RLK-Pelle-L-LEC family [Helianthus annuus]KAJ0840821.1 putative protein kinase RLK-Pelle-L-LEC family [Helianthus annuus]KAJ0854245.1 putative protein kinase RLK-Pelle-L-LEC family [Helianthus annuus]